MYIFKCLCFVLLCIISSHEAHQTQHCQQRRKTPNRSKIYLKLIQNYHNNSNIININTNDEFFNDKFT